MKRHILIKLPSKSQVSDDIYRFYPTRISPKSMKRFHGTDEKISNESYKEIIEFSYYLIKEPNG